MQTIQSIWNLLPGTVIRVSHGLYHHVGIVGDRVIDGERSILSFSSVHGGFVEEGFTKFQAGRQAFSDGYPSGLPTHVVIGRARSQAHRPYSWLFFNCEHFIRDAHGLTPESPQLQGLVALGCFVALLAKLTR